MDTWLFHFLIRLYVFENKYMAHRFLCFHKVSGLISLFSYIALLRSVLYAFVIIFNHMATYHVDLLICITDLFQEIYIECPYMAYILLTMCMVYLVGM